MLYAISNLIRDKRLPDGLYKIILILFYKFKFFYIFLIISLFLYNLKNFKDKLLIKIYNERELFLY